MRTEQYLEIYQKSIPFTEKMISMIGERKTLNKNGALWVDGIIEDIRFSKEGDLRITNPEYGVDCLAFEVKINNEWFGDFPSGIETPEQTRKFDNVFNSDADNSL